MEVAAWWADTSLWWINDGWPWVTGFVTSPGFGGVAVLGGAVFALYGVHRTARLNAWWTRADWALKLVSRENASDQDVELGLAAIRHLTTSRLATKEEVKFLSTIAEVAALDSDGDGLEEDDDASRGRSGRVAEQPSQSATKHRFWGIL